MRFTFAALFLIATAAQATGSISYKMYCEEDDGRIFDVITPIAKGQVHARLLDETDNGDLIFVICSSKSAALWVTGDQHTSVLSDAENIIETAAASSNNYSLRELRRDLENKGFETSMTAYKPDGCLCDANTIFDAGGGLDHVTDQQLKGDH